MKNKIKNKVKKPNITKCMNPITEEEMVVFIKTCTFSNDAKT